MTAQQIAAVNSKVEDDWNHGIFVQPTYIPISVKEPVFYWRHETGGTSGGSCWDSSNPQPYSNDEPEPEYQALDAYLELYHPSISFLQYKKLTHLMKSNTGYDREYYGNGTDYLVKYLPVREVESFLNNLA